MLIKRGKWETNRNYDTVKMNKYLTLLCLTPVTGEPQPRCAKLIVSYPRWVWLVQGVKIRIFVHFQTDEGENVLCCDKLKAPRG